MADFTLDTSGGVDWGAQTFVIRERRVHIVRWSDLDAFTQGYVEALWLSAYHDGQFATAMKARRRDMRLPAFSDLAPETLARIIADCAKITDAYKASRSSADGKRAWELRQTGEWDAPPPFCTIYLPRCAPYLGDDGRVYLREAA